ncbi:MAG: ribonuclease R [Clostridia bacterium]|nr:ribonuclease R [Clostridia bacterium]
MTKKEKLLGFISDKNYKPMKANEIAVILNITKSEKKELKLLLEELENEGSIIKNEKNKFQSAQSDGFIKGTFYANAKGFGFVIDDDGEKLFVPPSQTLDALNGDIIIAKLTKKVYDTDKCSECKIIRIVSHTIENIVGTFVKSRNFGFVVPDDKAFTSDIYISKKHCFNAINGQKVVAKITKWPEKNENPEGIISEILGFPKDDDVDIKSLIRQYSLNENFPEKAELFAESFNDNPSQEELEDREDFRNEKIFTIDGDDSKDFDDAVQIKKTKNGYILGVHIADVSYYVSENSVLDIEARKRGTSVYLPGCVVPMLPKKLSNGICSLNPDCERLTLSVIMEYDNDANLISHRIYEGVIRSKYRLTYNNVTKLLEGDEGLAKIYADIKDDLFCMKELSEKLKSKRLLKGSIDFDFPEPKIVLDERGKAIDVYKYKSTVSHKIIEEFMLAANTVVAEEMFWCELPFIYRIHENPSAEKINAFKKFVNLLGYSFNINPDSPKPGVFAQFYEKIKNSSKELLISKLMLRSLMKAKYSAENLGHFGLGFKYYCHFTSPIRRYPDLVIHRIIKEHINHKLTAKRLRYLSSFVKDAAKSSSQAEIRAMEAEREADDMKKAEYMAERIGNVYNAVISSVTSFGMFAETEFGIEGLISMSDLDDDYYEFNEKMLTLHGRNTGKTYNIGDSISIIVKRADPAMREIDYIIERSEEDE